MYVDPGVGAGLAPARPSRDRCRGVRGTLVRPSFGAHKAGLIAL